MSERGEAERDPGSLPTLVIDGACATVRLNRPALHNRIEPEDLVELGRLLDQVDADPAVRVPGADRHRPVVQQRLQHRQAGRRFQRWRLRAAHRQAGALPLPTICKLNGGVYGGSTDLALACDFRIGNRGHADVPCRPHGSACTTMPAACNATSPGSAWERPSGCS
ncbi:MAG: enoyl-CoA hydratase/isomerase family protein [Acetobacteraceae bacterium]